MNEQRVYKLGGVEYLNTLPWRRCISRRVITMTIATSHDRIYVPVGIATLGKKHHTDNCK